MKKPFNTNALRLTRVPVTDILVDQAFIKPTFMTSSQLQLVCNDTVNRFKRAGMKIKLDGEQTEVALKIIVTNLALTLSVYEPGEREAFQEMEIYFNGLPANLQKELKALHNQVVSEEREFGLAAEVADKLIEGMEGELISFDGPEGKAWAHAGLQKLVHLWFEEEVANKPPREHIFDLPLKPH